MVKTFSSSARVIPGLTLRHSARMAATCLVRSLSISVQPQDGADDPAEGAVAQPVGKRLKTNAMQRMIWGFMVRSIVPKTLIKSQARVRKYSPWRWQTAAQRCNSNGWAYRSVAARAIPEGPDGPRALGSVAAGGRCDTITCITSLAVGSEPNNPTFTRHQQSMGERRSTVIIISDLRSS